MMPNLRDQIESVREEVKDVVKDNVAIDAVLDGAYDYIENYGGDHFEISGRLTKTGNPVIITI